METILYVVGFVDVFFLCTVFTHAENGIDLKFFSSINQIGDNFSCQYK